MYHEPTVSTSFFVRLRFLVGDILCLKLELMYRKDDDVIEVEVTAGPYPKPPPPEMRLLKSRGILHLAFGCLVGYVPYFTVIFRACLPGCLPTCGESEGNVAVPGSGNPLLLGPVLVSLVGIGLEWM